LDDDSLGSQQVHSSYRLEKFREGRRSAIPWGSMNLDETLLRASLRGDTLRNPLDILPQRCGFLECRIIGNDDDDEDDEDDSDGDGDDDDDTFFEFTLRYNLSDQSLMTVAKALQSRKNDGTTCATLEFTANYEATALCEN
ncbi:hypothetical protein V1478_006439, partial [Vespula squamosa]